MFSGDQKVLDHISEWKDWVKEVLDWITGRFLKKFQIKERKSQNYESRHFQLVIDQYKKKEGKPPRMPERPVAAKPPEAKVAVKESIQAYLKASIRSTAGQLNFSKMTTHKILKN